MTWFRSSIAPLCLSFNSVCRRRRDMRAAFPDEPPLSCAWADAAQHSKASQCKKRMVNFFPYSSVFSHTLPFFFVLFRFFPYSSVPVLVRFFPYSSVFSRNFKVRT